MTSSVILVLLTQIVVMCLAQSAVNVNQIQDNILTLASNVRPARNVSTPSRVNVTFYLMNVLSVDTVSEKLVSNGWMTVTWHNDYATWNPEDYGGVTNIDPPVHRMWRPRLTMLNTLKEMKPVGEEYVVLNLFYNGVVLWFPAEQFETVCKIDVTYFPFDRQRCTWQLFTWGQPSNEVILQSTEPHVDLSNYNENGEWSLESSRSWQDDLVGGDAFYSFVFFEVTLRRRPAFLALTVLLPTFVLSGISVFVFTAPSESGERLSFSVTSFLTFGVFMSFIVDLMPSSAESMSILIVLMSCQMALSAVYVLLCILSLRLFHRDSLQHPVPQGLQSFIVCLEMVMCLDPPSKAAPASHQVCRFSSLSEGDKCPAEVKGSRLRGQLDSWAQKRRLKQEAYTQAQDRTWQRVSRSLDKVFFRFFLGVVIVTALVFFAIMGFAYNSAS